MQSQSQVTKSYIRSTLRHGHILIATLLLFCLYAPHAWADETAIEPTPKEFRQWSMGVEAQYGPVTNEDGDTQQLLTTGGFVRWTKGRFSIEPSFAMIGFDRPDIIHTKVRMRFEWLRSKNLLLEVLLTPQISLEILALPPRTMMLSWGLGIRQAINETLTLSLQLENQLIHYEREPTSMERWSIQFVPQPSVSLSFALPRKPDASSKRRKKSKKHL